MIKKLRIRAIVITVLSAVIVLGVIMTALNVVNYQNVKRNADELTLYLAENGGEFKEESRPEKPADEPAEKPQGGEENEEKRPPEKRGEWSEETPFETRFFSVIIGDETVYKLDSVERINSQEATELSEKVLSLGKTTGYIDQYRYRVSEYEGDKIIVFVDCFKGISTARTFLKYSVIISLLGILGVFIVAVFLSAKFVQPLVKNYEKQKTFITDAGHELKTPLTIISANNELIALEHGESESTRAIEKQVARMTAMVKNLTALARLEEDKSLVKKEFSLSAALKDSADNFSSALERGGRSYTLSLDEANYVGDENLIRRLFSLLLDNCAKYAANKTAVTLKRDGGKIRIIFANDALGIKNGNMDEVFDRFYRLAESRATSEGSGIGLSVAREIVLLHGGKISAFGKDGNFNVEVIL